VDSRATRSVASPAGAVARGVSSSNEVHQQNPSTDGNMVTGRNVSRSYVIAD
jgi:hypothetical protein